MSRAPVLLLLAALVFAAKPSSFLLKDIKSHDPLELPKSKSIDAEMDRIKKEAKAEARRKHPQEWGQRLVDYSAAVASLIRHATDWLRRSRTTQTVRFVVYLSHELDGWDVAMNRLMGRSFGSAGSDAVLESLCDEIVHLGTLHKGGPLAPALGPLLDALSRRDRLGIEHVCVFGRKLVERNGSFAERSTLMLYNETAPEAVVDVIRAAKHP